MPIDPQTGLYVDPAPSPFPSSVANGLIQASNGAIATNLAAEAENRRQLNDHLLDLRGQQDTETLEEDKWKFKQAQKQKADEDDWQQQVAANPQWTSTELMKHAMASPGSGKTAATMAALVGHEDAAKAKITPKPTEVLGTLQKEVHGFIHDDGYQGAEVADLLQPKYDKDFPGAIPQQYWDKLRAFKQSPETAAVIKQRTGAAAASNAKATKTNADDPSAKILRQNYADIDKQEAIIAASDKILGDPVAQAMNPTGVSDAAARKEQAVARRDELKATVAKSKKPIPTDAPAGAAATLKPQPAPGKAEGTKGTGKLADGTKVPIVVRNGQWVADTAPSPAAAPAPAPVAAPVPNPGA